MRRMIILFIIAVFFIGCTQQDSTMDRTLALRGNLLSAESCHFQAVITADYGDKNYSFTMDCDMDAQGNVTFCVVEPESIAGIRGAISEDGGKLLFDDTALSFELLTDNQISPVSAPWIFMRTLRGGYITSTCMDGDCLRATIDDSYADDALTLDIWLDKQNMPIQADIQWENRRILTLEVKNFIIG